jgi:hypothetical protein
MGRDLGAFGDKDAIDRLPAGRDVAGEEVGCGRVETQAFLDASDEEGEVAPSFFVLDREGEVAGLLSGGELGAGTREGGFVGGEEAEDGAEGGAGGVGAGLDEERDVGALLGRSEGAAVGVAGVEAAIYKLLYRH